MLVDREKLKEKYGEEMILVHKPEFYGLMENGFTYAGYETLIYAHTSGFFVPRYDAEYNTELFQPIPYIVLFDSNMEKVFVTRRIGGEERLIGKYGFVGGHIGEIDSGMVLNIIIAAAYRELNEEIYCIHVGDLDLKFIGLLKDKDSATSEHIGYVFMQKVSFAEVKEKDKLEGVWLTLEEAYDNYELFESWGKILLRGTQK